MIKEDITIDAVCKNVVIPEDHSLVIGCTAVISEKDVEEGTDASIIRRAAWEIMRSVVFYGSVYKFDHVDVHGTITDDDGNVEKIPDFRAEFARNEALKEIKGMLDTYVKVRNESERKDSSAMAAAHIRAIKK